MPVPSPFPTNTDRAALADAAVRAYAARTGQDNEIDSLGLHETFPEVVADLIEALAHLADLVDHDFREVIERGLGYHRENCAEQIHDLGIGGPAQRAEAVTMLRRLADTVGHAVIPRPVDTGVDPDALLSAIHALHTQRDELARQYIGQALHAPDPESIDRFRIDNEQVTTQLANRALELIRHLARGGRLPTTWTDPDTPTTAR